MPEPWEQLEGEGAKAFQAFEVYRDMGASRSLATVGQKTGKADKSLIERWSSRYNWMQRVRAYDAALDAKARARYEDRVLDLRERQADLGMAMSDVARVEAEELRAQQKAKDGALELAPQDIARLARDGVALERQALGVPDQVTRVQVDYRGDPVTRAILFDEQTQEDALAFLESAAAAAERARRGDS